MGVVNSISVLDDLITYPIGSLYFWLIEPTLYLLGNMAVSKNSKESYLSGDDDLDSDSYDSGEIPARSLMAQIRNLENCPSRKSRVTSTILHSLFEENSALRRLSKSTSASPISLRDLR